MTIECAILGLLAREPLAGYDLKKRMQDDPAMPWSGNNNQIYKALSAMQDEGLVLSKLYHQDGLPSRKVYTLTADGRRQLIRWLSEPPEMMELRKPFLAQLALADVLSAREVDALLATYAQQLRAQKGRCPPPGEVDQRDFAAALRALVDDNLRANYQMELEWADTARAAIAPYIERERAATRVPFGAPYVDEPRQQPKERGDALAHIAATKELSRVEQRAARNREEQTAVQYQVIQRNGASYLYYPAQPTRPEAMDATQIVGDCMGEHTNRALIEAGALPEAFFSLRTGLAGEVMQKLAQYHVKAALVLSDMDIKGKFRDMLIETNRGIMFRSFQDGEQAARWLMEE